MGRGATIVGMQLSTITEQHRSFLNRRGITDSIIESFGVHTADVVALSLHQAIVLPVNHVDGSFSFNKYRRDPMEGDVKPKYLYERGSKVALYGADKLISQEANAMRNFVIITEGELDTLVCWSKNIPAVSSTGGALSFQEEWTQLLKGYAVYVCFDNDEAGHKGVLKVLEFLPNASVIFVPKNIPDVKDISDYVARGGDLHSLLATAQKFPDVDSVKVERERVAALWGDYSFHDMYIEKFSKPNLPTDTRGRAQVQSDSDDKLERAKSVLCTDLLPFRRAGKLMKTECLWHSDRDPSLTYYPEKNNCYCFVCGKYADSVDITMQLHGLTFLQAVRKLAL